jgi:hypothetical protein
MKHLLNDLSEEEKNSIREHYAGGMTVMTDKFHKLVESKLGDAKPFLKEDMEEIEKFSQQDIFNRVDKFMSIIPRENYEDGYDYLEIIFNLLANDLEEEGMEEDEIQDLKYVIDDYVLDSE